MAAGISKKVSKRLSDGIRRFQPILEAARTRDINEADTVTIVKDELAEIFGYDKYTEVSSEHSIRGTYCDLAIKIDGQLSLLIEVKAIGLGLKDQHVKQAVDYAANEGVEWVALTNGLVWRVYRLAFQQPIEHEEVLSLNLLEMNPRRGADLELAALLTKEGWKRARLGDYYSQRQALSRFNLGALLLSDKILGVLRREVKRLSPGVRVEIEDVKSVLESEVLKREVLEGDKSTEAKRLVSRVANRQLRGAKAEKAGHPDSPDIHPRIDEHEDENG